MDHIRIIRRAFEIVRRYPVLWIFGFLIGPVVLLVAKEVLSLYGLDHKLRNLFGDILTKVSS